jgi:23S rRNA (uracil1939-C5)-methyltransferase
VSRRRKPATLPPVTLDIDDLDDQGRGVARLDGKVVFVSGALPGEQVVATYTRTRGRYDEARVASVLRAHPERVEPRCAHFDVCGGCVLQHLAHPSQVALKQGRLLDNLERLGGVRPEQILDPLVGDAFGYRTRARLGVKYVPKKGGVLVGFRERNGHKIADVHGCEVLDQRVGGGLDALREGLGELELRARIPQIEVALGDSTGALAFRHLDPLPDADAERLGAMTSALGLGCFGQSAGPASITPIAAEADEQSGDDGVPGNGAPLWYALPDFDLEMHFGPADFTQVNPAVNRRMVAQAMTLLRPEELASVLDLFSGIGNFSLPIARRAAQVLGVEGSAPAVQRARHNAALNGIENARFEVCDLAEAEGVAALLQGAFDGLLLDPPRSGAQAVVEALSSAGPQRIVYVSCSPATLARDAAELTGRLGYYLRAAGIIDMFPHTNHVESMALFER